MQARRFSIQHIVVIVLLVIHILPVWLFKYTATQDGPAHVHNAHVLKVYHNHENYILREVYERNPTLFPNWTSHVVMAGLMFVFPPLVCEKIFFSLCIGLLPLSLLYLLNSVQKGKPLFCLVGFIFAYNYLLHMGFYNFALSVSLFFFALGGWWRCKDKLSAKAFVTVYVWLTVVYLTHFQSYALLTVSLTVCGVFLYIYEALESPRARLIAQLKSIFLFLGTMLPAYIILLTYYLVKREGGGFHRSFEGLMQYFLSVGSIISFRDAHSLIGNLLLAVFASAFLLTVIDRVRKVYAQRNASESKNRGYRGATAILNQGDVFLLVAIILTFLYFRSPWSLRSGGMWISDRIHIYILLALLPFFTFNFHRFVDYAFSSILIVLALWHLGYHVQTYYLMDRDAKEALSSAEMIEPHTVLASRPGSWGGTPDSANWDFKYVLPFEHIEGYLSLENGVAYLQNYEPSTDHFPLRYKNREMTPDYVLVWRTEYDGVGDLVQDYEVIHSTNYNRLYRRKKAVPDAQLWKDTTTRTFDMQPADGESAAGHIAVYKDTGYIDGRYGWLSKSIQDEFKTGGGGFELKYWHTEDTQPTPDIRDILGEDESHLLLYQDNLWGEADGVFRIALPNGSYEVTCYFHAGVIAPVEINLIANGEKRFQELRLTSADASAERQYTITITDERLTQIIYTQKKRWTWSGFTVKQLSKGD
ncbi:hypothetical protein F4Y59_11005 [Candidatus Poribacteria bacterium]|nr:hypothetical protein [Candidatus Poribacteria bacterium]MYK17818.1 hypothetical protein [Candidatus Poribacteria bacterium]